jgi:hypothetical protein
LILAFLLAACADPELAPLKGALGDYEAGRAALDAGRPAEAAAAFARAREGDPNSPVLALWEARARAAAGDLAAAEALASAVITAHPDAGLAWYNRAAWRMRLGRPDDAAQDLRRALTLGVRSPYEAAIDPDFAPALGTAPFAELLPPGPVFVRSEGPPGAVFLGSDVLVYVELIGSPEVAVGLRRSGADPGCLRLDRVVDDEHRQPGVRARRVELRLQAVAPCAATLHFEAVVTAPVAATVPVPPVLVTVEAPSSFSAAPAVTLPGEIPLPGGLAAVDTSWQGGRIGGLVWALGRADERPLLNGLSAPIALELRADGDTRASGGAWPAPGAGTLAAGAWTLAVPAAP